MNEWADRVCRDWPSAEVHVRGGWRLGHSEGVTKRANSAIALGGDVSVEAMERFYRSRGSAPCVQVWPENAELGAALAARGYGVVDPTLVMARELAERPAATSAVTVSARPGEAWRALWREADVPSERIGALHRILDRVPAMGYGLHDSGLARGCVALNGDWAGVYGMVTRPRARGSGLAGQIVAALLGWAHDKGARNAYLLVTEANAGARRLYRRSGFTVVDRYHYRVAGECGTASDTTSAVASVRRPPPDAFPVMT
ncbi:GNAT family N-acetyltransferase [Allosalinactinospora lopnorensis]|uniref:GNAT family N-acetyltransferase n=1 Tax=Allosalinactinospora lopnorensis TaxID=1352348 RepID=UPI0009E53636|nr:GNAT family N-acetyltransferase [Allosalinactinospora lopnorensis]